MENLLSSYHLNPKQISELLQLTEGIIAGSAPLSVINGDFTPNDIDIWVEEKFYTFPAYRINNIYDINRPKSYEEFVDCMKYLSGNKSLDINLKDFMNDLNTKTKQCYNNNYLKFLYTNLMYNAGYTYEVDTSRQYNKVEPDIVLYNTINNINGIDRFIHPDGKKVQVIYTRCPSVEQLKSFDFNICRIYYNGIDIYSEYMDDINNKVFYSIKNDEPNKKTSERKEKYENRGFKYRDLIEPNLKKALYVKERASEYTDLIDSNNKRQRI